MQPIVDLFDRIAEHMPIELFVFVGTFLEELFSPIPSFVVLVPTGAAANAQDMGVWYLGVLTLISAFGRIIAAMILYWLADKFEDKLLARGRRIFGLTHQQIEQFGERLGKDNKRDAMLLFSMNAIPIFPTGALSVACGFVKVRFNMFVLCTFFGTMVNSLIYMTIGYAGLEAAGALEGLELASRIVAALLLVALLVWLLRRRKKRRAARAQKTM